MRIGVVIVNWNAGQFLYDCLSSVYNQSRPAERVLLIDNASTDNWMSEVSEFRRKGLELSCLPENVGFAAANNMAMAELTDCEWVALLNPDAVADIDWLQQLAQAVECYPGASSFASRMMLMDNRAIIDGAGDCYHASGAVWRRYHGVPISALPNMEDCQVFGACGGAAMYRREKFLEVGGFDEHYFCYCEDSDLAFRLQLSGSKCWYIHDSVVLHKGGGTTGDSTEFADYYGHRNLVWTWVKNMPITLLLLLMPAFLVVSAVMIVSATTQGRGMAVLVGKLDALRGIRHALVARAKIQDERSISVRQVWRLLDRSLVRKNGPRF